MTFAGVQPYNGCMDYLTLNEYIQKRFGTKLYRLSLSSGCSCPNRDGTKGYGGCTFCSEGGSGEFASEPADIDAQIAQAKKLVDHKFPKHIAPEDRKYIAYFQSFSNTWGDTGKLRQLYMETVQRPEIAVLDIATRPDCINDEVMEMLCGLNRIKPVWVELGLQTMHDQTAETFHRGYRTAEFEEAFHKLKDAGIEVIVHVILGLPGETEEMMLETVSYVSSLHPQGIKLHLLQILKGTKMAEDYLAHPWRVMSLKEYGNLIIRCLKVLDPEIVVHRITGDGPKSLLIDPQWCADKKHVMNTLRRMIDEADSEKK